MIWLVGLAAVVVGLLGGATGLWLVQKRGWYTLGAAVADGQDTMAFFVEGLRCLSGKSAAPCAKCGYRPGSGANSEDVASARSALHMTRREV